MRDQVTKALEPLNLSLHVGAGDTPRSWSVRVESLSPSEASVTVNHLMHSGLIEEYRRRIKATLEASGFTQTAQGGWARTT